MTQKAHHLEFEKLFRGLCHRLDPWRVFSDFVEMSAIALSNSMLVNEDREKRYLAIAKEYTRADLDVFPKLLAITAEALEDIDCDFLGEMFMSLELSNHWKGQFFTPFTICKSMSEMTIEESMEDKIKRDGFITVMEPACGAGATVIAIMKTLKDRGVNYQQSVHVTAIDVDATAALMCYVQLSLLYVPAIVFIGNTLSMEMRSAWRTIAHDLGFWEWRLKSKAGAGDDVGLFQKAAEAAIEKPVEPVVGQQLEMFAEAK